MPVRLHGQRVSRRNIERTDNNEIDFIVAYAPKSHFKRSLEEMIKKKTECITLPASLAVTAIPFLVFSKTRNDFLEYCTTKAYGLPMPWYIDHCLCGKGEPAVSPLYCFINVTLWVGAGLLLAWMIGKLKKREANKEIHRTQ